MSHREAVPETAYPGHRRLLSLLGPPFWTSLGWAGLQWYFHHLYEWLAVPCALLLFLCSSLGFSWLSVTGARRREIILVSVLSVLSAVLILGSRPAVILACLAAGLFWYLAYLQIRKAVARQTRLDFGLVTKDGLGLWLMGTVLIVAVAFYFVPQVQEAGDRVYIPTEVSNQAERLFTLVIPGYSNGITVDNLLIPLYVQYLDNGASPLQQLVFPFPRVSQHARESERRRLREILAEPHGREELRQELGQVLDYTHREWGRRWGVEVKGDEKFVDFVGDAVTTRLGIILAPYREHFTLALSILLYLLILAFKAPFIYLNGALLWLYFRYKKSIGMARLSLRPVNQEFIELVGPWAPEETVSEQPPDVGPAQPGAGQG